MPRGSLHNYLKQATTLTAPAKVDLAKGVADGLNYLHSKDVVHGDFHPGNVLIDGSGNPRLTDFGLATVVGDAELQLTTTIANHNPRWHAPEVLGIDRNPSRPTFKSDIHSFGSVMFFIVSGGIPWKEKCSPQITIELWRRVNPARPENIPNDPWNLIRQCWSWEPGDRPGCAAVLQSINQFKIDDSQTSVLQLPADLTGQIPGQICNYVAGGTFTNVFKCEWRRSNGPVKVAVKSIRINLSEEEQRRFRREIDIWAVLAHDNIVPLFGTTGGYGSYTALVFPWFQTGTLHRLIEDVGIVLRIEEKLNLVSHCIGVVELTEFSMSTSLASRHSVWTSLSSVFLSSRFSLTDMIAN
ncbi:kinase-like protein [Rhizopogon salebrosus TDB-379]|nr:kinase-like protein [Rhizopogon salebrosus TDB-379]